MFSGGQISLSCNLKALSPMSGRGGPPICPSLMFQSYVREVLNSRGFLVG